MKEIPLTQGRVALVDDADHEVLSRYRWAVRGRGCVYAVTSMNGRQVAMHHLILGDRPAGFLADHQNGCTLDNRRENLRWATPSQNSANRRRAKTGCIGLRGVTGHGRKFVARIGRIYLGLHSTAEQAAKAYDDAAVRIHGEFALLNYPRVAA